MWFLFRKYTPLNSSLKSINFVSLRRNCMFVISEVFDEINSGTLKVVYISTWTIVDK